MKLGLALLVLAGLQATEADGPQSLRGNQVYSKITMMMASDICSDHATVATVWVLDYKTKTWVNPTCEQWALADK